MMALAWTGNMMKEMFLAKGFDDFLTKPIEISKLDEIMDRWIPKEKREKAETGRRDKESSSLSIPGVDTQKGIAMTGALEAAGKAGDMEAIGKTLPGFHRHLTRCHDMRT
jgi:CheY-like chemotaxis protein